MFRRRRACVSGAGLDAAWVDVLFCLASRDVGLYVDRSLSRQVLTLFLRISLLACGGGGGGFSTVTELVVELVKPRESVQVALIVMGPGEAPVVFRVAEFPLPEMLPPLDVHPPTVTGTLSGLVQVQVMVADAPVWRVDGLAEQEICGGFLGGSFTVKLAVQLAVLFFFAFGSLTVAVTV
jgi:hypothetical protein